MRMTTLIVELLRPENLRILFRFSSRNRGSIKWMEIVDAFDGKATKKRRKVKWLDPHKRLGQGARISTDAKTALELIKNYKQEDCIQEALKRGDFQLYISADARKVLKRARRRSKQQNHGGVDMKKMRLITRTLRQARQDTQ